MAAWRDLSDANPPLPRCVRRNERCGEDPNSDAVTVCDLQQSSRCWPSLSMSLLSGGLVRVAVPKPAPLIVSTGGWGVRQMPGRLQVDVPLTDPLTHNSCHRFSAFIYPAFSFLSTPATLPDAAPPSVHTHDSTHTALFLGTRHYTRSPGVCLLLVYPNTCRVICTHAQLLVTRAQLRHVFCLITDLRVQVLGSIESLPLPHFLLILKSLVSVLNWSFTNFTLNIIFY